MDAHFEARPATEQEVQKIENERRRRIIRKVGEAARRGTRERDFNRILERIKGRDDLVQTDATPYENASRDPGHTLDEREQLTWRRWSRARRCKIWRITLDGDIEGFEWYFGNRTVGWRDREYLKSLQGTEDAEYLRKMAHKKEVYDTLENIFWWADYTEKDPNTSGEKHPIGDDEWVAFEDDSVIAKVRGVVRRYEDINEDKIRRLLNEMSD